MTHDSDDKSKEYSSPISGFGEQPLDGGPIHYGGQAVIEGVMMRGPTKVATAIRLPSGEIDVHAEDFMSFARRNKLFRVPVVRGGFTLIESLSLGIKALNYSANAAMEAETEIAEAAAAAVEADHATDEPPTEPADAAPAEPPEKDSDWKTKAALTGTMIFAFALGILIFFYIPLVLTDKVMEGVLHMESGILFNVIDGIIRVVFFLIYIWAISRWKEMRRVFEYHGAEHKTIFMEEAGEELTPENAAKYTTKHPRCGTSFLLIVMVTSILVFMITGKPETITHRLMRLLLIPVIAGVSYEIMKISAKKAHTRWARAISAPGVWLQNITTKEPDRGQLEVAIAALKAAKVEPVAAGATDAHEA
jgi:uncharacterized protein YqhQ